MDERQSGTGEIEAEDRRTALVVNLFIRLGLLLVLLVWCYRIIEPFVMPVAWAIIIAVAVAPLYQRLVSLLGGNRRLAAAVYVLVAMLLLIVPTLMIAGSLVDTGESVAARMQQGGLAELIPAPDPAVRDWPWVGEKLHAFWARLHEDPRAVLGTYQPQLRALANHLAGMAATAGGTVLMFLLSILVSGILLAFADEMRAFTERVFARLLGNRRGPAYAELAGATIRSVAQGVLGVALIQAVAGGAAMYLMDIPGWGLWTLLILVLAVAQLPPLLVLGPVILYAFHAHDTLPAILFAVWGVLVSVSDGLLKPLFLGRGMETPTLVILVGAIGGMMTAGIFGLFAGAVILALGYELFLLWLGASQSAPSSAGEPAEPPSSG